MAKKQMRKKINQILVLYEMNDKRRLDVNYMAKIKTRSWLLLP